MATVYSKATGQTSLVPVTCLRPGVKDFIATVKADTGNYRKGDRVTASLESENFIVAAARGIVPWEPRR